jgi:predicted secreted protein
MATTGVINGTLLGVYVSGTLIAKSTNCTLNIVHNTRNSTSKDSGGWEEALGAMRSWTASGDFLDAEDAAYRFDDLFALIGSRAPVTLKISSEVSGDKYYTGSAILTSLDREAPMEDNVSGAYSFKGTGALSEATVV